MGKKKTGTNPVTKGQYEDALRDVVYLAACVVNGEAPDRGRCEAMNLELLYRAAKSHLLTSIAAEGLERAGIVDSAFRQAKAKAIRKNVLFDAERESIFSVFEQEGIWYMPLKGAVLKEYYPGVGLRQMADNDILFDAGRQKDVKEIMCRLGYSVESYAHGNHDVYKKPPVLNFEMHTALFGKGHRKEDCEYYRDVKKRLVKDSGNGFGYHFKREDFYVYMLAHEYKHYTGGGTGLRSLLDIYVFLKHWREQADALGQLRKSADGALDGTALSEHASGKNTSHIGKMGDRGNMTGQESVEGLDMEYVQGELRKLGLTSFEQQGRHLAETVFGQVEEDRLTDDERWMRSYIFSSGTYGTKENSVANRMRKMFGAGRRIDGRMRLRYYLRRLFPDKETMLLYFPFAVHRGMLPVAYVYRFVRGITVRLKKTLREVKIVEKQKKI